MTAFNRAMPTVITTRNNHSLVGFDNYVYVTLPSGDMIKDRKGNPVWGSARAMCDLMIASIMGYEFSVIS